MKTNFSKLPNNENTADFSKKLYDMNRLSMCTQDSLHSKKSKMPPPESTLQEGINNSNINRQNFDGQSKIGHLKNLQNHSFKENRHSLGATTQSIASTKDTLSRSVSHYVCDGHQFPIEKSNQNLKFLDEKTTAFEKRGSIVQLPLPPTDHKKDLE